MPGAETHVSFAPPCQAVHSHTRKHRELGGYSSAKRALKVERDQGRGCLPTPIAFPMVANFAAFDEFRHEGCHHAIAAVGATRGRGKGADTGQLCCIAME